MTEVAFFAYFLQMQVTVAKQSSPVSNDLWFKASHPDIIEN